MRFASVVALSIYCLIGCQSTPSVTSDGSVEGVPDTTTLDRSVEAAFDSSTSPAFYLQIDPALPSWVAPRFQELLQQATKLPVILSDAGVKLAGLRPGSVVLAVGDTTTTQKLVPSGDAELQALKPDGLVLRSYEKDGVITIVAVGKANPDHHGPKGVNLGTLYGAYAALEALGFAFLHPLEPLIPATLQLPEKPLSMSRSPRWPQRGIHIHTMHPIELTDMLNGWGPKGKDDAVGFVGSLAEWRHLCEWLVANRQNMVEWMLLKGKDWAAFAESITRLGRLKSLVEIAHQYGIGVGVDTGLVLEQQHNFRLIDPTGDLEQEKVQLRQRVDYLMSAGFDFLSTEIGTSEFTSPDDKRMLAWIDELGSHIKTKYGKTTHIKIHCSTGQTAPNFKDPRTGKPINYNFLPQFAIPEIGVMPHTVQVYALDDPAPTYGNSDFDFMRKFLRQQAGAREVLWHPETAYWVSYDVDIPLFLPVYAHRRLRDLRLIAADEDQGLVGEGKHAGTTIQGQMIFSSGWEWGYWLNDVVAARAAYDPPLTQTTDSAALEHALVQILRPFGGAAGPLAQKLRKMADDQLELLIRGKVGGKNPATVVKRNGQAYLQGWESFDDLGSMVSGLPMLPKIQTQPDKLGLVTMRNPLHGGPSYSKELRPLLLEMKNTFAGHLQAIKALEPQVPPDALPLFQEIVDAVEVTALRARQVLGLYDYVDGLDLLGNPSAAAKAALADARKALDETAKVVGRREKSYRVPADRIAGWRDNPTAYPFTYLWTVRSLHYLWRDEAKAVKAPLSPCYLNIMDPTKIAFGEGFWVDAVPLIQSGLQALGLGSAVGECLTAPTGEPSYPPAGVRP